MKLVNCKVLGMPLCNEFCKQQPLLHFLLGPPQVSQLREAQFLQNKEQKRQMKVLLYVGVLGPPHLLPFCIQKRRGRTNGGSVLGYRACFQLWTCNCYELSCCPQALAPGYPRLRRLHSRAIREQRDLRLSPMRSSTSKLIVWEGSSGCS